MTLSRRAFVSGLIALPAICKAENLMKVRPLVAPGWQTISKSRIYGDSINSFTPIMFQDSFFDYERDSKPCELPEGLKQIIQGKSNEKFIEIV